MATYGAISSQFASGTSLTIATPSGTTGASLLVAAIGCPSTATISAPGGWNDAFETTGNGLRLRWFWRRGGAGNHTFGLSSSVNSEGVIFRVEDDGQASPIGPTSTNTGASGATITFNSVNVPTDDSVILAFGGKNDVSDFSGSQLTERFDGLFTYAGTANADAGPSGNRTVTASNVSAAWLASMVVIKGTASEEHYEGEAATTVVAFSSVSGAKGATRPVSSDAVPGDSVSGSKGTTQAASSSANVESSADASKGITQAVSVSVVSESASDGSKGISASLADSVVAGSSVTAARGTSLPVATSVTATSTVTASPGKQATAGTTASLGASLGAEKGVTVAVEATAVASSTINTRPTRSAQTTAVIGSSVSSVAHRVGTVTTTVIASSTVSLVRSLDISTAAIAGSVVAGFKGGSRSVATFARASSSVLVLNEERYIELSGSWSPTINATGSFGPIDLSASYSPTIEVP